MKKEIILKNLLESLLESRLNRLEKRQIEEIKDINIIKINISNQEALLKSIKFIKKNDIPKKKILFKQKTDNLKLLTRKKNLSIKNTPLDKSNISKEKEILNKNNNNKKYNFTHLNRNKIDGNFRLKTKKNTLDHHLKDNNNLTLRIKKYKTPIRQLYHETNSYSKNKNVKKVIRRHEPKTPSCSFLTLPYKTAKITSTKLIDSINRANKSYILENNNNTLNKSNNNMNMINSNLYINNITSNNKKTSHIRNIKNKIKISLNTKSKTNKMLEKYIDKEKMKNNNEIFILNKNFGEWLGSEEGRDTIISITYYLDIKAKFNLLSCHKNFIKYLYHIIEDKYTEFKENNKINPNSNVIQEKINEIKEKYSQYELDINNTQFILSKSSLKALEFLNDVEHIKFFNKDNYKFFSDDIYIVYKIIFQLIKNNEIKNASNKKDFYEKMGHFVHKYIKDNKKVGDFFKKMVNEFEFSEENIFQIKKMIKGKEEKLKPKNYSQICATTGLVIFLIKDILEYLGLSFNSNKRKPIFVLMNLEYLQKVKTKLPNYLKFLKTLIPN